MAGLERRAGQLLLLSGTAAGADFAAGEAIFKRYGGRPHWGKLHSRVAEELRDLYPEWDAFQALRRRWDPDGVFLNDYLRRVLGA